jgi:class 3 adenylate cyclase/energy-coupling factor transporter ATP-binding protein EcfA2
VLGPALTIRKFNQEPLATEELVRSGTLSEEVVEFLHACVRARLNILVAGGTGSGKTTLLNLLAGMIPAGERIVTVEDVSELRLPPGRRRVVRMASHLPDSEGRGEVTVRDLLISALRMRPDRLVLGETRGEEALDLLQAINTGHDGTMTTVHANSPRDALARLEIMATSSDLALPLSTVRQMMASAVDLIVQIERLQDGSRAVVNVSEVSGMEGDLIVMQEILNRQADGHHAATGIIPKCYNRILDAGVDLPVTLFTPRRKVAEPREGRQVLSILFGDMRGFVKYLETHAPEHVGDMLKAYFRRVDRLVRRNDGIVYRYTGDGFLALFGSSVHPVQDHAWKALLAAWRIQQDVRDYHETLPPDDRLYFDISINTGPVVASRWESEGRVEYVGDAISVAVLLERHADARQIVIGESTYKLVKDRVEVRELSEVQVGRRRERAYEVIGLRE